MPEGITPNLFEGVGIVAVVLALGFMLARGLLYTRGQINDLKDDRDGWRTESRIKDQQIHELTEQNTAMLRAFGPTLTDFLRGLRQAAGRGEVAPPKDDEVDR